MTEKESRQIAFRIVTSHPNCIMYDEPVDDLIRDIATAIYAAGSVEAAAQFLFGLLDDIDTASDRAKGDDRTFREIVERIQRRRFEVASVDASGQTVTFR